jgi:hypothetical protein
MKGFKSAPPKLDHQERERRAQEIISGATASTPTPPAAPPPPSRLPTPWRNPGVRVDVVKQSNVRLSEPLHLKLEQLYRLSGEQKQKLLAEMLAPAIDQKLRELGYRDDEL